MAHAFSTPETLGLGFRFPAALVESYRASPPHRPREYGLAHPVDTSRSILLLPWVCFPKALTLTGARTTETPCPV